MSALAKFTRRPAANQPAEISIPTFADVSEEYRRLVAKTGELEAQRAELDKERQQIAARLETQKGIPQPNIRVAALLGDQIEGVPTADDRQRLQQVTVMQRDIAEALSALAGRIAAERGKASKTICDQLRGAYTDRVKAVCMAMVELNERHRELLQFTEELDREEVSWTGALYPMAPQLLGHPNDGQGRIAHYLREAVQHGFMDAELIPERFRRG